jgi:hypothetical protein
MNAYIVWDHSRKEHGEPAELLDMFLSKEDAEKFIEDDTVYGFSDEDVSIEEREIKGSLPDTTVVELISFTLAGVRPGMRAVIGDASPEQYDKADRMAEAIAAGLQRALRKLGYIKEEAGEPEAEGA